MDRMVIIGGGVAGLTAAENARKNNGSIEIIMISEEKYFPYSRIKLSKYMYNEFNPEELYLKKEEWYREMNIKVLLDKKVMEVNPEKNWILLDNHEEINYTTLVIASGSSSFVPPISGVEKRGVFTVRNMEDVLRIQSYIRKNNVQNICVVGGGLLGIEAAWSLREVNDTFKISIIETMPRLLPRQLDDEGSSLLEEAVKRNGINLYKGVFVKVYSTGDFSSEGLQGIKYDNGVYSKLFFRDGVICGGILIGDTKKSLSIKSAVEEERNFEKELKENVNILHII
jgi:nitrite reductase (NADH) large subunit